MKLWRFIPNETIWVLLTVSFICAGNDYSDINWRSVSSRYKSYPIPSGASVDYD